MTKIEIVDFIYNILSPVDKTGRFHKAQIAAACDVVYAQQISRFFDSLFEELDTFSKEYTNCTITLDSTKNTYYTALPCNVISIPRVTSGVLHVNTKQGTDLDFVPTSEIEYAYMGGSTTQLVDTTIGYRVQGQKIWYNESMTADIASAGVRVVVLPRFSAWDRTDEVNIPKATDLEFMGLVIQLLAPTAPVDLKANNA